MLDEPTANLDLGNQLLVLEQARSLARKTILYCLGDKGTQVIARGSFHAETMNMLAENAAVLEDVVAKGTGNEVDMEQLLLWDPEYIIFAPDSCFHEIAGDEQWQQLSAVAAGRVYLTPESPYGWLSSPPGGPALPGHAVAGGAAVPGICGLRPPGGDHRILPALLRL